jgi:acetamidase/formamidase
MTPDAIRTASAAALCGHLWGRNGSRRLTGIVAAVLMASGTGAAETHRFTPTRYFNTFSFAHPPVLRIKPGDRVITHTVDSGGTDAAGNRVTEGPNPQTGPFFVEGAEPGDVLLVTLNRIEPNRATARTGGLLAPYTLDPAFLRSRAERQGAPEIWAIDKARGIVRTTTEGLRPRTIELPLVPMLGCVGTAPARKEAISTSTPGRFGGNMDYFGLVAAVTVMLPVSEPGALLFIGDGHARQGEGEMAGVGLETSMDVEFTVGLVKKKAIGWPRMETTDAILVLGSARPLLQALQHATTEMLAWLMEDYGFDERSASLLIGQALEVQVANIVDPNFTAVAKLRKAYLPAR